MNVIRRFFGTNTLTCMVFTGKGDDGSTDLLNGSEIGKSSEYMECIGDVDELCSNISVAISFSVEYQNDIEKELETIQDDLFHISTRLGYPEYYHCEDNEKLLDFDVDDKILEIEELINDMCEQLPVINGFIRPGGGLTSSVLHVCRTVCRRTERSLVSLNETIDESEQRIEYLGKIQTYFNRLSDYLFCLARKVCLEKGQEEKFFS